MSVSQSNGSTPHSSRRRRRGGATRRYPGDNGPVSSNASVGGRTGGHDGSSIGTAAGGGRGGGRRTIWEDGSTGSSSALQARLATAAGRGEADSPNGDVPNTSAAVTIASANGVGAAGGGARGRASGGATTGAVHPAMLESEFLAATGQADADASGVASLSLEEVPYDRDLRWCNTASDSRPRPTMDTSVGVYGRVGVAIAHDTGDYERFDRHYQELWKDREEIGPPPGGRGRGGRTARGGRARGRASGAPSGAPGRNPVAPRSTTAGAAGPIRGGGSDGAGSAGSRRERGGSIGTGPSGRGARGGGRTSPGKAGDTAGAPRVGEGGPVDCPAVGLGLGPGNSRRRAQRGGGGVVAVRGGGGGGNGSVGGRGGAVAPKGVVAHPSPSSRSPQPMFAPAYRVQGPAAAAATTGTATAAGRQVRGGGGGSPAQVLHNGRRGAGWEGREHGQHELAPSGRLAPGQGPWTMEAGPPARPGGYHHPMVPNGGMAPMRTPPLVPTMPPLFGGLPPEAPEYLGDLANALSSTPPSQSPPSVGLHSPAAAAMPPLGPTLLSNAGIARNGIVGAGGGGGAGIMAAQNGGAALSPYTSPQRSKTSADIRVLQDPSLDVDIQDICADPDLNADAPAFVPGGYFPA